MLLTKEMSWEFLEGKFEISFFFFFFEVQSAVNLNKPSSYFKAFVEEIARLLLISTHQADKQTEAAMQPVPGSTRTQGILSHPKLGLLHHPGHRRGKDLTQLQERGVTGTHSVRERCPRAHQPFGAAHGSRVHPPQQQQQGLPFPKGHGQRAEAKKTNLRNFQRKQIKQKSSSLPALEARGQEQAAAAAKGRSW